jgi:N-acetylmuramoyl-L-alanine amidase
MLAPTQNNVVIESQKTLVSKNDEVVVFKVQIFASSKKIDLQPDNFKGLNAVSVENSNTVYRYMYGETRDYNESRNLLETAKAKGYSSAFLVAYKNGKKINIQEVIK